MSRSKNKSIEKRTLDNTIAGLLSFGLSIVQSILLVPLLLGFWGEEKYALWIALWAFVSALRLFDIGFLNLFGNEFALAYNKDKEESSRVLGSAIRMIFLTGIIEIIAYSAIWIYGFVDDVTGIPNIEGSYMLYLGIFVSLFPWALGGGAMGVVLRAIPALGLYSKMLYFSLLMKFAEILVLTIGSYWHFSLFSVSVWMSVSLIIYTLLLNFFLKKIIPSFYPWWKNGSWSHGFSLFKRSLALTTNNILEQYINNGIIIMISKSVGLALLPIFTTIRTITNTASQLTNIVLDPLFPDIIRFHVLKDYEKMSQLFLVNWLIVGILINVPFAVSLLFIEHIYTIWTSNKLAFNMTLFQLLALTVSVYAFGRPLTILIKSLNLLLPINTISILRFLITFGISIPFIQSEGLWVLGVSLLMAEITCSILLPIFFIHKYIPRIGIIDFLLGLSPTFLLGMLFIFYTINDKILMLWLILLIILQALIFYYQWARINLSTRNRLLALLPLFQSK